MTAPTLSKVRSLVAKASGIRTSFVSAKWVETPRLITFPTGLVAFRGRVAVSSLGFADTVMTVTTDAHGTMVR